MTGCRYSVMVTVTAWSDSAAPPFGAPSRTMTVCYPSAAEASVLAAAETQRIARALFAGVSEEAPSEEDAEPIPWEEALS